MESDNGRYSLIYNGEIYNNIDLRNQLNKDFHINWHSNSDTETLLRLFENYEINFVLNSVNGMFAFSLLDKKLNRIIISRDRVGEKPLYITSNRNYLGFASDLNPLKKLPFFNKNISKEALQLFLKLNYIPTPYSIYENSFKLYPGTYLEIRLDNYVFKEHKNFKAFCNDDSIKYREWWSFKKNKNLKISNIDDEQINIKNIENLLSKSVKRQLLSDVPVGAFLSGGVDSSLIVSNMQKFQKTNTYTIGYDFADYDESADAKKIANILGTNHHEYICTKNDLLGLITELPSAFSEPFADSSQIPTYLISKLASSDVTVSLSGDGGDELFGGYNRYCKGYSAWKNLSRMPYPINYFFSEIIHSINPYKWNLLYNYLGKYITNERRHKNIGDKLYKMADIVKINSPQDMYLSLVSFWDNTEKIVLNSSEPMTIPRDYNNWIGNLDDRENMMFLDTISYLPDDILTKVDRSSMAVSLESRAPFLNHPLIELSQRIPIELKIKEGKGKWILRNILNDFIPTNFIDKQKTGFGIPIGEWLRGPLKEWAESLIDNSRLKHDGYFNAVLVSDMWEKHINKDRNYGHHLWSILMFQAWLETK